MASSSIKTPFKPKPTSDSRRRVRIVAKIRGFTHLETSSSDAAASTPWVSVQRSDGDGSDGVTISFTDRDRDQTNSRKDAYKLDYCYGQDEDVEQIYSREVKPLLAGVYNGLNTSILAYGARGSGKTHVIQGFEGKPGLASLAMADILSTSESKRSSIAISCYEVYQDHVYDLLEPKGHEVIVLENAEGRIQLKGLSQVAVKSVSEFHNLYYHGCVSHKPTPKVTVDAPYRSHKGLIIHVCCNESDVCIAAKINFVDLAGYEDTKRKGNGGFNLGETAWINKSLYTLQNVVKALNTNERVPYRESKLTRMLQDSIGGKNQTLVVTCLNPIYCLDTIYTVSLASRSCQVVNQDSTKKSKNVMRPMPVPSSKVVRPQSVPSMKKHTSSQSHVMEKQNHGVSSAMRGRKLFDGANYISSSKLNSSQESSLVDKSSIVDPSHLKKENSLSDASSGVVSSKSQEENSSRGSSLVEISSITEPSHLEKENPISDVSSGAVSSKAQEDENRVLSITPGVVSLKAEEEEILLSTTVKETETTTEKEDAAFDKEHHDSENTTANDYQDKVIILKEENNNLDKENNKSFVNGSGSPSLSERLREISNTLKSLESSTTFNFEILKKSDSLEDLKSRESSTPFNVEILKKSDSLEDLKSCESSTPFNVEILRKSDSLEDLKSRESSTPFNIEILKKNDPLEDLKSPESSIPFNVEILKKSDPLEHPVCSDIVEFKTPKCESKMGFINYMEVANSCTPRETYSVRSSGIKQSLVQEFLMFVNTSSKEELLQLKGIGEKRATYMINLRENSSQPFKNLDDLKNIGLTAKQIQGMMRNFAGDLLG